MTGAGTGLDGGDERTAPAGSATPIDRAALAARPSRRTHRLLVMAFVLSPLVALVILVLAMLRTIEHRAGPRGPEPPAAERGERPGR